MIGWVPYSTGSYCFCVWLSGNLLPKDSNHTAATVVHPWRRRGPDGKPFGCVRSYSYKCATLLVLPLLQPFSYLYQINAPDQKEPKRGSVVFFLAKPLVIVQKIWWKNHSQQYIFKKNLKRVSFAIMCRTDAIYILLLGQNTKVSKAL